MNLVEAGIAARPRDLTLPHEGVLKPGHRSGYWSGAAIQAAIIVIAVLAAFGLSVPLELVAVEARPSRRGAQRRPAACRNVRAMTW